MHFDSTYETHFVYYLTLYQIVTFVCSTFNNNPCVFIILVIAFSIFLGTIEAKKEKQRFKVAKKWGRREDLCVCVCVCEREREREHMYIPQGICEEDQPIRIPKLELLLSMIKLPWMAFPDSNRKMAHIIIISAR
jgi:hypothetical protein